MPSAPAPRSPSELSRAVITVALAAYLVGLVLSIAGNTGSGTSALVRTIHGRLFAPWMVPPWLDIGFDYPLTYGAAEDGDHAVEVRRYGDRGPAPVRLPGTLTGERAARWRRLARALAPAESGDDRDGLLVAAVGRGMFDELDDDDVVVSVVRTPLADRGGPPPEPATVGSSRVRMVGGELQLVRSEARGEVAPLVRPPKSEPSAASGDEPRAAEAAR